MENKVLYTGGTFDLFHYGHVNFLRQCNRLCSNVVVALNTDEFVTQYKGKPIMTYVEREKSLLSCPYVSKVIPNLSGADSKPTILSVNPDIVPKVINLLSYEFVVVPVNVIVATLQFSAGLVSPFPPVKLSVEHSSHSG